MSLIIGEIQINTMMLVCMKKSMTISNAGEDIEQSECFYTAAWSTITSENNLTLSRKECTHISYD